MKRSPNRGDNQTDLELKKFMYDPDEKKSYINIDDDRIVDAVNGITGTSDTNTEIINTNLTANNETEIDLGLLVKGHLIRSRTGKKLKLALNVTETATKYISIMPGAVYTDQSFYNTKKIYLLCEAADTVEILIKRNT